MCRASSAEVHAMGLRIRSEFDLPGASAICAGEEAREAELRIVAAHACGEQTLGPYERRGGGLLFHARGVARYLWEPGPATITIDQEPGAAERDVAGLLIATMLPAVVWALGDVVLHAAGVLLPGAVCAAALVGSSGTGKSRLAGGLAEAGASLVGDDALRVRAGGRMTVFGLPGGTLQRGSGEASARDRKLVPASRQVRCAPLGAVVLLDVGGDARPARLHAVAAVEALLQNLHRPRVPRLLGRLPGVLPQMARLVREVPVYRWKPQFEGAAADTLLAELGEALR